uniref:Cationic amino acid transporter C-terminal domain-containing protein n=1 Tax=Clastoptera arizonana TaxID=38151 RepID=A0A1B6C1G3_9HEMI
MGLWTSLTRRKILQDIVREESKLGKVLTVVDLTALSVGSTLGVGVYVLAGEVSREQAGPAVVLSFFIAAIASIFAGLCFAEFGARVPKAGSAYIYSYVTIGEFAAFLIGWNLIIEYIIGGASVARAMSVYIDPLLDHKMEKYFRSIATIDSPYLAEYIDFFALGVLCIVCLGLAFGLKKSVVLNNLLTSVNVAVVLLVIIVGSLYADLKNWQLPKAELPADAGEGGFLPFGVLGAIKGAATCFFGYVGFDCIATTGEEVKNAQKAIPASIIISLFIIFLSYFGISAVLTLMWPYYLQNVDFPIPFAFSQVGLDSFSWVIAVGSIFGLMASLIGSLYPLPRIIYAMSQDGLLFSFMGSVHPKFKTPFNGTIISGFVTGIMAAVFNLRDLINLMSLATLVAYTIVAASVLILRYKEPDTCNLLTHEAIEQTHLLSQTRLVTNNSILCQIFNCRGIKEPTSLSSAVSSVNIFILCFLSAVMSGCLLTWEDDFFQGPSVYGPISICSFLLFLIVVILVSLYRQPSCNTDLSFKVPFVPLLPTLSIFINMYLMFTMDTRTWIRFGCWMVVGLIIYFGYGMRNSSEGQLLMKRVDYETIGNNGNSSTGSESR